MKTQKETKREARLDPYRAALHLLRTLLPDPNPTVRRVEGLIRQRNFSSLAELGKIEDTEYQCPIQWSETVVLRQIAALFKKNDAFTDVDRCTSAAHNAFERGERICRITNKRLDYWYEHRDRVDPELNRWLQRMETEIALLLGDTDEWSGAIPDSIRLTNGATEDRSRRRSFPFLKITGKIRAPRAAVPFIGNLLRSYGVDLSLLKFTSVERNAIALVPKNWKTFRTIAKEPVHSLPFQLSLDAFLKGKLRRWGVDLSSQSKNQEYARLGSIDGSLATLDLEMASDTLSYNAVAWMIPTDWLAIFDAFRSSYFSAPWGDGSYAKYSSMGNGFTFTLETLIFTAACRAVGSRRYAVYGDDIIVESHNATPVARLLSFLGFKVNEEKSFSNPESRFRESCGGDYYKGQLITPFYLRECPKLSDNAGLSHALNGLVQAAMVPGPLWAWAKEVINACGLRLVPWNEDSRSGVHISPSKAWIDKKLEVDRRRVLRSGGKEPSYRENPDFGFPVFKGYSPAQDRRTTKGWRSLFLWYLQKGVEDVDRTTLLSNRTSARLLQMDGMMRRETEGTATVTSYVSERTRYVHKTRRYDPKPTSTPSHLFLWSESLG
jgi:hypothetical protein